MNRADYSDSASLPTGHIKKTECLKMIKILNRNFKNLEKEQKTSIQNKKTDKEFAQIFEIYLTGEMNLKAEQARMAHSLDYTSKLIEKFKQESKQVKPSPQILQVIKSLMEQIDSSIIAQKESFLNELNQLEDQEKLLAKEIDVYEKKIHSWSSASDGNTSYVSSARPHSASGALDRLSDSKLLKEVIDFDKFLLQNGGHKGGWDEVDHNLFLRIRNKNKGVRFIDELVEMIATKNRDQIEEHEKWYQTYLNLNELKKKAIQNWKENKKKTVDETVNQVDAELKLNQEIEKELKNRLEKKREEEKRQRNAQLNEWKLERSIQRARELEQKRIEEERRIEREERERAKKEEMRQKVVEYQRQKQALNEYIEMEQILIREAERKAKSKQAQEEINYFQSRDLNRIKEKQFKQKREQEKLEEKKRQLEMSKERVEVDRDPSRLYQMTSTWKNRVTTPRSESCGPVIANRIPHLAVPTWRQGV